MPPKPWATPTASPNATTPHNAPTSGSRFTNELATSAGTRACAHENSQKPASVPVSARPSTAATGVPAAGAGGAPSRITATGSAASAAAPSWTAVTAAASRPASSRGWTTIIHAAPVTDASTSRSPVGVAPDPPPPATSATPASATSAPAHLAAPPLARPDAAAITATSTGTAPTTSAAWLTLVRSMPAFWSRITPPYPSAPTPATAGVSAARRCRRATSASSGAAIAKRATASQLAPSHSRPSLESGTVRPHSVPAVTSATIAQVRCVKFMPTSSVRSAGTQVRFDSCR
jgi:hypothetical protein